MEITISRPQIYALERQGAIAVPALSEEEVELLCAEAESCPMTRQVEETSTGVMQDFSFCSLFKEGGLFHQLAKNTSELLTSVLGPWQVLCTPIGFNDLSLQAYPLSKEGQQFAISPHLDYERCLNVVAVFVLKGKAPFCICEDRSGSEAVEISARPGDLILMRMTGYKRNAFRPFHFLGPVTEARLSFGLRHLVPTDEVHKYYDE